MIYHLYSRTQNIKGKSVKTWYYWYYDDETGKQVRKSCGKNGKPCTSKRDALIFLEELRNTSKEKIKPKIYFNDFCKDFFSKESLYIKRLEQKQGIIFSEKTLEFKNIILNSFLKKFGDKAVDKVTPIMIEDWLITLDRSNSYKNHVLTIANEIYKELYRQNLIPVVPFIERFKNKNKRKKGSLSITEIKNLFPYDTEEILKIWEIKRSSDFETFQFATIIFFMLGTGVRGGELRAIKKEQIINGNCLLLSHMIDAKTNRVDHLKKGNDLNKKWRVTIIPQRVLNMLDELDKFETYKQTDYLFEVNGEPIKPNYINRRFVLTLEKNGINCKERNITAHSLRYTYNTIMRKEISETDLRLMIGHTNEKMTDYYDTSTALDNIDIIKKNEDIINNIWN